MTRDASAFRVSDDTGRILALTPFAPPWHEKPGLSEQDALALAELIASLPTVMTQLHKANLAKDGKGKN